MFFYFSHLFIICNFFQKRFISENTVEEKILERQIVKLKWDTLVTKNGNLTQKSKTFTKDQLKEMIMFGANEVD